VTPPRPVTQALAAEVSARRLVAGTATTCELPERLPVTLHVAESVEALGLLAQYHQTSSSAIERGAASVNGAMCPRAGHREYWNKRWRRPMPMMCRSLSCPVCIRVIANRHGAAIAYARPQQLLLLTQVGESWETLQRRMNHLWEYIRRDGLPIQAAWHAEHNPAKTGTHIHAWSHSGHVDRQTLRRHAVQAGMGPYVRVRPVRIPKGDPPRLVYGMKSVFTDPVVGDALTHEASSFLSLNGDRLVHATQGYFRDLDGRQLSIRGCATRAYESSSASA
jgi:hypothetical protein